MSGEWSLKVLYDSYEDEAFQNDFNSLDEEKSRMLAVLDEIKEMEAVVGLRKMIEAAAALNTKISRLYSFISLKQSVNTTDSETGRYMGQLFQKLAEFSEIDTAETKYIASVENLDEVIGQDEVLTEYAFFLKKQKESARHLFSDEVEAMIAKMNLTGGNAWEKLFEMSTSTLKVDYEGGEVTLSEIRNLAYESDPEVRKKAYEAELAAYEKIELPVAFALNNIKNQVRMLAKERGYASPLSETLTYNSMKQETLDAMLTAMKEALPEFHNYLKAKAKYLGHEGSLPWYDLFAPVGGMTKKYSLAEARTLLSDTFRTFSDEMADMMERAFDEDWIDFYPREGKVGGAFCAYLSEQKESRILTNYGGLLSDIDTLAHELGHAFHGKQLAENRPLNQDCPMQLAETASIFNEVHLTMALLDTVEPDEKLSLLESLISGTTQIICDIYSRYLFEKEVFARCESEFLMPEDLKEIMLNAQKEAYGDGLDHNYLHPYMWACKGHYYSAGLSYYNFPYAFGGLFSMGLYALYQEQGAPFVESYKSLLRATAVMDTESAAASVGIDITKPDFWRRSLKLYGELMKQYEELL